MPWPCRPETLDFIARAPAVFVNQADLPVTPERLFEIFADVNTWPTWFDDMKRMTWLGSSKGGLGDSRLAELGLITVAETFLAWEPGSRFCFRVDWASLPLLNALVEDYQITALPDGRAHLDWRVHYELKLWARLIHPILRLVFGRQFKRTVAGLQRYLA